MTEPDERLPSTSTSTAEPSVTHDPEAAEDYAESVPIDPSPDEVNRYLQLVGDPRAEPDTEEPPAVTPDDAGPA